MTRNMVKVFRCVVASLREVCFFYVAMAEKMRKNAQNRLRTQRGLPYEHMSDRTFNKHHSACRPRFCRFADCSAGESETTVHLTLCRCDAGSVGRTGAGSAYKAGYRREGNRPD